MPLLYKPDWDETKARYLAWWNHEYFGRCALSVTAPKADPPERPEPPPPRSIDQLWYDVDYAAARADYRLARTYFGGEALPVWSAGYPGHTGIPTFLGCPTTLDWETGWWDPVLTEDEPDIRRLRIDRSTRNYRVTFDLLRRGARDMKGKGLVTIGAFGGCGDTLAALRSTWQLLHDCSDRPGWVRESELYLMDMWCEHYEACYREIRGTDEGSTCWFTLWSPGRFYAAQNDFSYMISPAMFRDLFIPALRRQTEFLDHAVYHVDGIEAFAHVDALCELPRLQAIQILPGAGKPSPLHYMDTLKKVQRYGRNLHITIPPGEVHAALENLSARGLFIQTWCDTEANARRLLQDAESWSVDRS